MGIKKSNTVQSNTNNEQHTHMINIREENSVIHDFVRGFCDGKKLFIEDSGYDIEIGYWSDHYSVSQVEVTIVKDGIRFHIFKDIEGDEGWSLMKQRNKTLIVREFSEKFRYIIDKLFKTEMEKQKDLVQSLVLKGEIQLLFDKAMNIVEEM